MNSATNISSQPTGQGIFGGGLSEAVCLPLITQQQPDGRWPTVLGEQPARPPDDHWWSDGLPHAWLTGPADSRVNPAGIGVPPWTGELCRLAPWRFMCATTPGLQAAPARPAHGLQNATTGHG